MNRPQDRVFPLLTLPILALSLGACGSPPPELTATQSPPVRASLAVAERVELEDRVELPGTVVAAQTGTVSARVMATVTAVHVGRGQLRAARRSAARDRSHGPRAARLSRPAAPSPRPGPGCPWRSATPSASDRCWPSVPPLSWKSTRPRLIWPQARGAVEQAQGALAAAESMAADTRVTAPFAGRVVRRWVDVGDLASPGRPLVEIETEDGRRLAVAVPEHLWARAALALGDSVPVRLDAHQDLGEPAGIVAEIVPAAGAGSHAFEVEIQLPRIEGGPVPTGAAGRASIVAGRRSAITVPVAAVVRHGGLELVVARTADDTTETLAVTTGRALDGERIEVLSGLAGGEELLVGLNAVPPAGSPVEVLP